jgi:hypothetical protein
VFFLNFFPLHSREALQAQVENRLRLDLAQAELGHQTLARHGR